MSKTAARKAAQRAVPKMKKCEMCGAEGMKLNRHHPDYDSYTEAVILCTKCHAETHKKEGTWGRGNRCSATCVICGKIFTPTHSKKGHKTCSPECLSELGRINAVKRWGNGKQSLMSQG